jgi:vesicle coat complex subunit
VSDKRITKKQTEEAVKKLIAQCPKADHHHLDAEWRLTHWAEAALVTSGDLNVRVVTNAANAYSQLCKSLDDLRNAMNQKVQVTLDGKPVYVTDGALHRISKEIVRAAYRKVRYFEFWVERYFGKVPDPQRGQLKELTSQAGKGGWLDDE